MSRSLEQKRAAAAVQFLTANPPRDELAKLAKAFPAHVINNGLGAALAFLRSKKEAQHDDLYRALREWLLDGSQHLPWNHPEEKDLLERLVKEESGVYMAVTQEALAYLNWFRRLATAAAGGD